jgi:hypothetical protein
MPPFTTHKPTRYHPASRRLALCPQGEVTCDETRLGRVSTASARARMESLEIRPIRAADAELIVAARAFTSRKTYYRRFHHDKRYFSAKELTYLTDVDGRTHVALVAIERGEHPRLAAVARFSTGPTNPREGELAICVHDRSNAVGWAQRC